MKKIYFFILLTTLFSNVDAQVRYSFTAATGTYTSIVGTSPTLERGFPDNRVPIEDEGYANGIPIGFPFNYNGTAYSSLSVNTNGFVSFKNMTPVTDIFNEGYFADDLEDGPFIASDVRPVIAPFWDDLDLGASTNLRYATSGIAGSRVFTMEWSNVYADYTATIPVISFQLKLFEATGNIEFIYRSEAGVYSHSGETNGASIGLTAAAKGQGQFLSLQNSSAAPSTSSTDNMDSILTKPVTGQIYRFTPTFSLPISLVSFKGERVGKLNHLTWSTATEQNNKGFELQKSADGRNFSTLEFVASKALNGSSAARLQYSFSDLKSNSGAAYYRLKQLDSDNKATYSAIVSLKALAANMLAIRSVYPNPTVSVLNMVIATPENNKIDLLVSDLSGKIVYRQSLNLVTGENLVDINVSRLAAGNYTLKAICNAGCESVSTKFVKQ